MAEANTSEVLTDNVLRGPKLSEVHYLFGSSGGLTGDDYLNYLVSVAK